MSPDNRSTNYDRNTSTFIYTLIALPLAVFFYLLKLAFQIVACVFKVFKPFSNQTFYTMICFPCAVPQLWHC